MPIMSEGPTGFSGLSQSSSIRFQYLHSETEYPGAVALDFGQKTGLFGGDALQAEFLHMTRNWQAAASYIDINPGFRADYGFMPRVDVRTFDGELHRLFWGDGKSWFTRFEFWLRGYYTTDHDGRMTDSRLALGGSFQGPLQSMVAAIGRLNKEYLQRRDL